MSEKNIPIYQVIENDIKKVILDGTLKQGDLIPSETELSAKYNVSRMTVRQAINNLLVDGFIYRHKGRGTFVAFNKMEMEKTSGRFSGFSSVMKDLNIEVNNNTVLEFKTILCDELLAKRLQLEVNDEIVFIERLKEDGDIPLVYERLYLPKKMFPDITKDVFEKSFYDYVENELNWKIKRCTSAIEARALTKSVANLFKQKEGEPALYVSNVTYLDNGRAFEYSRTYYNAQYFRFRSTNTRKEVD